MLVSSRQIEEKRGATWLYAGSRHNAQVCILVQLRSFSMGLFFLASIEMRLGPFHRVLRVQTRLLCTPLRTLYCMTRNAAIQTSVIIITKWGINYFA